jgi:hypothetical protein
MTIKKNIRRYLTSFCWQSCDEIASLLTAAGFQFKRRCLSVTLYKMSCSGELAYITKDNYPTKRGQKKRAMFYRKAA